MVLLSLHGTQWMETLKRLCRWLITWSMSCQPTTGVQSPELMVRRWLMSASCSLTSMYTPWHKHTLTYTQIKKWMKKCMAPRGDAPSLRNVKCCVFCDKFNISSWKTKVEGRGKKMLSSWKGSREIQVEKNPLVQRGLGGRELQSLESSLKGSEALLALECSISVWATIKGAG